MNQELIDQLLQNLMTPNNIHGALPGLIIKAACLRHNHLSEKPDGLTEDEQDELSYLQEWFDQNHFDYLFDNDDQLHMRDMTPTNYAEPPTLPGEELIEQKAQDLQTKYTEDIS